jgi:hypothetical protein
MYDQRGDHGRAFPWPGSVGRSPLTPAIIPSQSWTFSPIKRRATLATGLANRVQAARWEPAGLGPFSANHPLPNHDFPVALSLEMDDNP